jgi:DNA polymerase III subunit gamma/tau
MTQYSASVNLNLARKWRARTFDQVVGQELSIRMLKNSLFLGHYFPVYLFAGQRGSGKTSTGRILAAALNCDKLSFFQKNPKENNIPCLSCPSCQAMTLNKHPDFIETDAASHTGVDNVRTIIDAASLLPLMGQKKIYLIDEAHMLSKAAFNAFLKILEEPPLTALFILATTDPERIIETVRSRCFQVLFNPVASHSLVPHLHSICTQENILIDQEALESIAYASQGSVRDALNLIEQARFSTKRITKDTIRTLLGTLGDERVIELLRIVLCERSIVLYEFMSCEGAIRVNPLYVWQRLLLYVRAALWATQRVYCSELGIYKEVLLHAIKNSSYASLTRLMNHLYEHELLFLRSTDQYICLEMILLKFMNEHESSRGNPSFSSNKNNPVGESKEEIKGIEISESNPIRSVRKQEETIESWNNFLDSLCLTQDPLASSLFKQARFMDYDKDKKIVTISFAQQFSFFKELLEQTKLVWNPLLQKAYGELVVLNAIFTDTDQQIVAVPKEKKEEKIPSSSLPTINRVKPSAPSISLKEAGSNSNSYRSPMRKEKISRLSETPFDVSDEQKWQKSHLLLRYFPGTIYQQRS